MQECCFLFYSLPTFLGEMLLKDFRSLFNFMLHKFLSGIQQQTWYSPKSGVYFSGMSQNNQLTGYVNSYPPTDAGTDWCLSLFFNLMEKLNLDGLEKVNEF